MKIVLISPKGPLYRSKGGVFKKSLRYQPLTLTTLAAYIPEELKAEVVLIDEGIQEIPPNLKPDLVGITVITGTAPRSYQLATEFRAKGVAVVLGGPHVTLMPDEALEHADSICIGYAEETWPELLRDFSKGKMKPSYQQSPTFIFHQETPFPKRELFDKNHFLTHAVFEATRSCAHDCEFCVAPSAWGRIQIQKPIEWVLEDIRRVGKKKILFIDLNLISDRNYARELFRRLIPLNIQWFGLSTVLLSHDRELMELVARSGCKGLLIGLETISAASLKDAGKQFNESVSYKPFIQDLHQLGIAVQGCFVFGLDHDTPEVFDETVEFAIDAGVDLPRFAVLTPFPGTPLHRRLKHEQRIISNDWELYDGQHVVFQPKHMSVEQLATGHERAWKMVYRWSAIGRRLWCAGNFKPLLVSSNIGYRFYAHHLHKFYNCDWQVNPLLPNPLARDSASSKTSTGGQDSNRTICG